MDENFRKGWNTALSFLLNFSAGANGITNIGQSFGICDSCTFEDYKLPLEEILIWIGLLPAVLSGYCFYKNKENSGFWLATGYTTVWGVVLSILTSAWPYIILQMLPALALNVQILQGKRKFVFLFWAFIIFCSYASSALRKVL